MAGRLITKPGLSERLGVPVRTIEKLMVKSGLPYLKLGPGRNSRVWFDVEHVEAWLAAREVVNGNGRPKPEQNPTARLDAWLAQDDDDDDDDEVWQ